KNENGSSNKSNIGSLSKSDINNIGSSSKNDNRFANNRGFTPPPQNGFTHHPIITPKAHRNM
ncbi:9898_t:CDS:1, partial [Racocetra persica]